MLNSYGKQPVHIIFELVLQRVYQAYRLRRREHTSSMTFTRDRHIP